MTGIERIGLSAKRFLARVFPEKNTGVSNARYLIVGLLLASLTACSDTDKPVKGFILPEGDVERGQQVFIKYRCQGCHTIPSVELPPPDFEPPFILEIGGKVYRVRTYGELMTSIVNPDHVVSGRYRAMLADVERETEMSPMPNFTSTMTVEELTDLVYFLHDQYTRLQPRHYRGYHLTR